MKLVVGLGNPGQEYGGTRHNVGFMVVAKLARDFGVTAKQDAKFNAMVAVGNDSGHKLLLAQPLTYMNLSGEAVARLLHWHKLKASDLVIVYDDFSLPYGQLRVRPDGSAGGHNGIKSLIQHVGQKFDRVKIGIGPVPPGRDVSSFVLGRFTPEEQKSLDDTVSLAGEAAMCVVRHGVERAMATYNGGKAAL